MGEEIIVGPFQDGATVEPNGAGLKVSPKGGAPFVITPGPGQSITVLTEPTLNRLAPIKVACKCGWQGKSDELIGRIQSADLHCPRCSAPFSAWPTREAP